MNFIKKFYEKRKITNQLLKTYSLGGFKTIENVLAKLTQEHEDIAIYLFKYINTMPALKYDFYNGVLSSKKIHLSNNIIEESIPNRFFHIYFENHKDELSQARIIYILENNFISYYDDYAADLYRLMELALNDAKYYETINSLIIKFPTYESASYIRRAMKISQDYSIEMVAAMIATNNLEELKLLRHDMSYQIPNALKNKIKELEEKENKHSSSKAIKKKAAKLATLREKLDESINKI